MKDIDADTDSFSYETFESFITEAKTFGERSIRPRHIFIQIQMEIGMICFIK
jgi:hypothetical protein